MNKKRIIALIAIILLLILIFFLFKTCSVEIEAEPVTDEPELTPSELCKEQNKACEDEQQQAYDACETTYEKDNAECYNTLKGEELTACTSQVSEQHSQCWAAIIEVHAYPNTPTTCALCDCVCTKLARNPEKSAEEYTEECLSSYTDGKNQECYRWFDWAKTE